MGTSVIWYLPHGASSMERIAFPQRITGRVGPRPEYRQSVSESVGGAQFTVLYGGRSQVTLQTTWTRDAAGTGDYLRRQLLTLLGHLARGGTMVFAEDEDKAFAGFVTSGLFIGSSSVGVDLNLFDDLAPGGDCSDSEVVLHSDHDGYLYEHLLCSTQVATIATLDGAIVQDMAAARWVLLREYGSWPAVRVPMEFRGSLDVVLHDHERIFTLQLPLEDDPSQLEALYQLGIPLLGPEVGAVAPIDFDSGGTGGIKDPPYGWR